MDGADPRSDRAGPARRARARDGPALGPRGEPVGRGYVIMLALTRPPGPRSHGIKTEHGIVDPLSDRGRVGAGTGRPAGSVDHGLPPADPAHRDLLLPADSPAGEAAEGASRDVRVAP